MATATASSNVETDDPDKLADELADRWVAAIAESEGYEKALDHAFTLLNVMTPDKDWGSVTVADLAYSSIPMMFMFLDTGPQSSKDVSDRVERLRKKGLGIRESDILAIFAKFVESDRDHWRERALAAEAKIEAGARSE